MGKVFGGSAFNTAGAPRTDAAIGILCESDEWSDHHLAEELRQLGHLVRMVDMQAKSCAGEALTCGLLVSRVFASAWTRGHQASLEHAPGLLAQAVQAGIPCINPPAAHAFETSKALATAELARHGLPVPVVYGVMRAEDCAMLDSGHAGSCAATGAADSLPRTEGMVALDGTRFPLVVKPDCGGRSAHTAVVHTAGELEGFVTTMRAAGYADVPLVFEEYVEPTRGFVTRIEIIGGACALIVKRSVEANGLSGYHHGSTYAPYQDCPHGVAAAAEETARVLGFELGSFDIIEAEGRLAIIDCNSVSNVSEDCTEMFKLDLMREYAHYIDRRYETLRS